MTAFEPQTSGNEATALPTELWRPVDLYNLSFCCCRSFARTSTRRSRCGGRRRRRPGSTCPSTKLLRSVTVCQKLSAYKNELAYSKRNHEAEDLYFLMILSERKMDHI